MQQFISMILLLFVAACCAMNPSSSSEKATTLQPLRRIKSTEDSLTSPKSPAVWSPILSPVSFARGSTKGSAKEYIKGSPVWSPKCFTESCKSDVTLDEEIRGLMSPENYPWDETTGASPMHFYKFTESLRKILLWVASNPQDYNSMGEGQFVRFAQCVGVYGDIQSYFKRKFLEKQSDPLLVYKLGEEAKQSFDSPEAQREKFIKYGRRLEMALEDVLPLVSLQEPTICVHQGLRDVRPLMQQLVESFREFHAMLLFFKDQLEAELTNVERILSTIQDSNKVIHVLLDTELINTLHILYRMAIQIEDVPELWVPYTKFKKMSETASLTVLSHLATSILQRNSFTQIAIGLKGWRTSFMKVRKFVELRSTLVPREVQIRHSMAFALIFPQLFGFDSVTDELGILSKPLFTYRKRCVMYDSLLDLYELWDDVLVNWVKGTLVRQMRKNLVASCKNVLSVILAQVEENQDTKIIIALGEMAGNIDWESLGLEEHVSSNELTREIAFLLYRIAFIRFKFDGGSFDSDGFTLSNLGGSAQDRELFNFGMEAWLARL